MNDETKPGNFTVDFIGVGAPKCGTTWLAKMLDSHPDVCLSSKKETNYFLQYRPFYVRESKSFKDLQLQKNQRQYSDFFKHCQLSQIKGEFSTYYLYDEDAPKLLYENFPQAKILIILRNPIEKFISQLTFAKAQGYLNKVNYEMIIREREEFIAEGYYMQHIEHWLRYYPREQVWIGLYDDICSQPQALLQEVYDFLGVNKNHIPENLDKKINHTSQRGNVVVTSLNIFKQLALGTYVGRSLYKLDFVRKPFAKLKNFAYKNVPAINDRNSSVDRLPNTTKDALLKKYDSHTERLARFLQRDLQNWLN